MCYSSPLITTCSDQLKALSSENGEEAVAAGGLAWFALYVRTKYERTIGQSLRDKGFETYIPCVPSERQWKDRRKTVEVSLFPNYVFCRFDLSDRFLILTTPEVYFIVGSGRQPVSIPDEQIASIERVVLHGTAVEALDAMHEGKRVAVVSGPLTGLEGIVVKIKNADRLVVNITLLQRAVATEISRDAVQVIQESRFELWRRAANRAALAGRTGRG
jgi:transcription antitermination factor NusG